LSCKKKKIELSFQPANNGDTGPELKCASHIFEKITSPKFYHNHKNNSEAQHEENVIFISVCSNNVGLKQIKIKYAWQVFESLL
jgi:hypothetical protein